MKKTVTVNLNGRIFTMDEDAFNLLENYLQNLRIYFRKDVSAAEILADFEARIAELLHDRIRLGHAVIILAHVEEVIARMGRPADFGEAADTDASEETTEPSTEPKSAPRKLFRNLENKIIAGVCSGIATRFGWDAVWIRLILVALFFLGDGVMFSFSHFQHFSHQPSFFRPSLGFALLLAYIIARIIIPPARTAEEKLQMRGEPITVENIGKMVAGQAKTAPPPQSGCFALFGKACLVTLAVLIASPLILAFAVAAFVLIVMCAAAFAALFGVGAGSAALWPAVSSAFTFEHPTLGTVAGILLIAIPLIMLIYWSVTRIARLKPMPRILRAGALVLWFAALVLFFCAGLRPHSPAGMFPWWKTVFATGLHRDETPISGNSLFSEKEDVIREPVEVIHIKNGLTASFQIEQTDADSTVLFFSGDENLIDNIRYDVRDNGQLHFSARNPVLHNNNLTVRIRTPLLKKIELRSAGTVAIPNTFTATELELDLAGAGEINAGNMQISQLKINARGIGSVNVAGQSACARLDLKGIGSINASELEADTVYARLNGIGSINCNPSVLLNAQSHGIGEISYLNEPLHKEIKSKGIGHIGIK